MRIAVTGGIGFIGRAVVALALDQGHRVVSIDRTPAHPDAPNTNVDDLEADLTSYPVLERSLKGWDALIHLAAIPSPHGSPDYEVHNNNVVGSYNAFSAAARLGIQRVCQASSVNATGGAYSRWPRYDYFPVDEQHTTYNEDPYSLSKWICEQQADSFARRHAAMTIASLRFHWVVADRAIAALQSSHLGDKVVKHLWGYTLVEAAARACLLSLTAPFQGHEVFYIVAPDTTMDESSMALRDRFFPSVPLRLEMQGNQSFFSCTKAQRVLGWSHSGDVLECDRLHHRLQRQRQ
jgi:nucleoside-diphosphate-sugar epimerase